MIDKEMYALTDKALEYVIGGVPGILQYSACGYEYSRYQQNAGKENKYQQEMEKEKAPAGIQGPGKCQYKAFRSQWLAP